MSESLPSPTESTAAAVLAPLSFRQKAAFWLLDLLGVAFWIYTLAKLFVFDIDVWALNALNPHLTWLLAYKFPITLALLAITMALTRSLTLALSVLYIALYPLVIVFWKIPRFLWKQKSWLLAFAFINSALTFFRSFKRNFILTVIVFVAALFVLNAKNVITLYVSMACLFCVMVGAYALTLIKAFKPSAIFQMYKKMFPKVRAWDMFKVSEATKGVPEAQLSSDQLTARTNELQNLVLYNRTCLFVSRRLRDYQNSRINVIAAILSIIGLLILTVFTFALINLAAFKIDPSLYKFDDTQHSLFIFVYYSAGSMFYATNGLVPIAALSQAIQIMQFLCSVMLLGILATVFMTTRTEKYSAEIGEVVKSVEKEGASMESTIRRDFQFDDITTAIGALQNAKAGLVGIILSMTRSIGEES